ncbi:MAG: hypothetical protein GY874_01095 [Desulfobacteraceae bacterium]|nr:hypothetical protein [Desulfobacteraceae bacterium]
MKIANTLILNLPITAAGIFSKLLGRGVMLDTTVGISLQDFLRQHIGIKSDYIENRLQTVFVNGRAADCFDEQIIADQDVIALSVAMPGLVGAAFRKKGRLSVLRKTISQKKSPLKTKISKGVITLKLFNMVAQEIGPQILSNGVRVDAELLAQALKKLIGEKIISLSQDVKMSEGAQNLVQKDMQDPFEKRLKSTTVELTVRWSGWH